MNTSETGAGVSFEQTTFYDAMEFLGLGRVKIAAESVGRTNWLLETATAFANDRDVRADDWKFHGIFHKIAWGRANAFAADAAGLRCAWQLDQGNGAIAESSICKRLATNTFWEVADDVVQIHGSGGLAEENPFMDNLYRARIMRIVEGTDDIQLNTIAKQYGVE
ncbi:acyl-CoA dehydrogenase [Natrialba chahannaoensis JCM 10990]|uniref:Acyl-CoA dehydrogenase n=1 Tax=Natrialba chahannaoensis JCM 10990 TaxID=1227492 RepID=M0B3F1_9EURY|nr:acyl-CoA dehydrogenase family protein [Natrialba chahannaoensis]ELZ04768.1 acyl-CoA dehydrogenase [Natrialba chahannaoensis JCM 10990]